MEINMLNKLLENYIYSY